MELGFALRGIHHCMIGLFTDHMLVRVGEKNRDKGDTFFKRVDILKHA